ncbi:MAG: NirA family protein [Pseudomonadota bacterium]|nr:NirA family protein [Pseudomonadota bacterium]
MSASSEELSPTQKEYLQGFTAGLAAAGALPFVGVDGAGKLTASAAPGRANQAAPPSWHGWPLDEITREEQLKREQNPLDIWDKLLAHARADKPPEAGDVYRFKFHGLFYVAPAQDSFMVRVRIPGNVMSGAQMRALAGIAEDLGDGRADVTTRGNIQIRQIAPRHIVSVLTRLADAALTSRGSGADNVRNITSSPLAGVDPLELIDTEPLARALQHYLLNNRDLYGLPRKFNVSFDGGGRVSVVADTNDIGFVACRAGAEAGVEPGVWFRVFLGGVTGHERFAEDSGLLVGADECIAVAAAMLRVYAEHGDRTDRKKARLCYLLDRIGVAEFLARVQAKLAFALRFVDADRCAPRAPVDKHGHLGVHRQRQPGLSSIGIAVPVGRMTAAQMRGLAALADDFGRSELRLTVWQQVVLPHVGDARVDAAVNAIAALGFAVRASPIAGCVVACTGNQGCRFSATDTKGHAVVLARELDARVALDAPINLHLTGCPHSCAQHCIADIGLLGTQVAQAEGRAVEGYHVLIGGGVEQERGLGREIAKSVPFADVAPLLERLLQGYIGQRRAGESFVDFARRHDVAELQALAGADAR